MGDTTHPDSAPTGAVSQPWASCPGAVAVYGPGPECLWLGFLQGMPGKAGPGLGVVSEGLGNTTHPTVVWLRGSEGSQGWGMQ